MLSRSTSLPLPLGSGKHSRLQRHALAVLGWIAAATVLTLLALLTLPLLAALLILAATPLTLTELLAIHASQ